jgi:glucose/arabinose dehydrogenase
MAESTRSIAVPLATNLHLAFDTQLLRTHTAWTGPGLSLFGTPYTGSKTPFLSIAEGIALWTMPPFCPWSTKAPPANFTQSIAPGSKFTGIDTHGGNATLLYQVGLEDGSSVAIQELPRKYQSAPSLGIVRRFEIGASPDDLWFLAHAEMNASARLDRADHAVMLQRTNGVLLTLARSSVTTFWTIPEGPVSYEESLNAEEKGESVIRKRNVSGRQARAVLKIPAHNQPIAVEVLSAVFQDASEAEGFGRDFPAEPPAVAALAQVPPRPAASTPRPKVVPGDKATSFPEDGDAFYRIEHFPLPREISLQVTGMDWLSEDQLAVCTWTGEIYVIERAPGPVGAATYRRFARGLNEPLGLKAFKNDIYVVQKPELTRISDTDGNGEADRFETVNAGWGSSGNYHAFAFGPLIDKQNNFYAVFCGQHGRWDVPFVGWCVKISPNGQTLEGFASGLRAPNGSGLYGPNDDVFMADNQGNWVGACKLNHIQRGKFYGFPSGTPAPEADYKHPKSFAPPAVWFPRRWSPSTSGLATIEDDRFGPFKGQMLAGDFQNAVVLRVFLEKVNGEWQGAVWPFARGFLSGVNRLSMGPDGRLYVGGLKNAAWAATAPRDYSLDRVRFTGKVPFEIREVRATRDGLDLAFTQAVDDSTAGNADNYDVRQFTYLYHETYGSPEIDHHGNKDSSTPITVKGAKVSEDHLKVRLILEGWKTGYVTWVRSLDIQNAQGQSLWHDSFYYTLNQVPANL